MFYLLFSQNNINSIKSIKSINKKKTDNIFDHTKRKVMLKPFTGNPYTMRKAIAKIEGTGFVFLFFMSIKSIDL